MEHLISGLFNYMNTILAQGGYWIVALSSAAEALPLLGSIVPGHSIVLFGGFFARLGILNVYEVIAMAAIGAMLGDVVAFYIGRKYGMENLIKWGKYFLLKEQHIEKARSAIHTHTGKALIIGRFNPVTRSFMPFLAGVSKMDARRFWFYNIIGGISWATVSVLVGYLFGASYTVVSHFIGRFTSIGIILGLLIVSAYYFVSRRRHIFSKYDFHILVVCLLSLYIFFKSIQDVFSSSSTMMDLDLTINLWMAHNVNPVLVQVANVVSDVLSPWTLGGACVLFAAWYAYKRYWSHVYIFLIACPIGLIFDYVLKFQIARGRPLNMLTILTDYSFPSGHAVAASIFFTLSVYFFSRYIKNHYLKELFLVANVLLAALVCASRVYINVHWFSDVLAGATFGLFWTTFSILVVRYTQALVRGRGAKKIT